MKMTRNAHRWLKVQNGIFYLLLVTILGALAYLTSQYSYQFDWTYGSRNSLSTSTTQLLKELKQPLKFTAYIPDNPEMHKQFEKLVEKYRRIKPDTSLEFINPDLSPKQAEADEVQYSGQLVLKLGEGDSQKKERLDSTTEASIASALTRMTRTGERIIIVIEGHGERQPLWTESNGLSRLTEVLEKSGFKIQPHNLLRTQSIPTNAQFVVIAGPQQAFLESETKLLVEYIKQGGNLLWLQDPGDMKGLQPLADTLSIQLHQGTVVDANEKLQAMLGIKHAAVVPVIDYDPRSPITRDLKVQTLFPFATMVTHTAKTETDGLVFQVEEFLQTLPQSWLEVDELQSQVVYDDTKGDLLGPITIGMDLKRNMELPAQPNTPANAKQQRIVVIGDSDFITNGFIGSGGNLDLSVDIFNWLSADDSLVGIKTNPAPDTNFAMNDTLGMVLALFFLMGLPLILVGCGTWIWFRRRRL